ncbi:MAG: glycosyltransferase family 39 protein [Nanoarchaeota archaeon]
MSRSQLLLLILILLIGLIFRTYQIVERFEFAHDGDLYSWIVKDIVINGHFRLIGQETSAPGIFIGALFYYLITPFFLLTNMDPVGAIIPVTILGMLTIVSYYFVFSKLFNIKIGLIAAFLYAVLLSNIGSDRWIVPTNPTNLWAIWYFYIIINLARGNFNVLPLLGILIGLIWHIHIALIPTLAAVPIATLVSKKLPTLAQVTKFAVALFVSSLPLLAFEIKHNFQQTLSVFQNFGQHQQGAAEGLYKFQVVWAVIGKNINALLFAPKSLPVAQYIFLIILLFTPAILVMQKKILSVKEIIPLYAWILGIIIFFTLSSSPISEYYFSNIGVIVLALVSICLYLLLKSSTIGRRLVFLLLIVILLKNGYFLLTQQYYNKGYVERKAAVDYIVKDAKLRNFPCFSINYITSVGENVGFRYFFFLKNAHIAVPGRGSPVYSIVIPDEYAYKEVKAKFGHIGVIPPTDTPAKELMMDACSGANTNLTDPMFGYVE